jgi:pimeloyl-ACP methyl ester carboxylesterase
VILTSYGRDGSADFDAFTAALAAAGYRVLRPQPRSIAGSTGPMTGVTLDDLADDVARVIATLGRGPAVVLGHAFGNFVARAVATDHPDTVSAGNPRGGLGPHRRTWGRLRSVSRRQPRPTRR